MWHMPKNINNNQKAIEYSSCKYWIHIKCNGTSNNEYNEMLTANSLISPEEIAAKTWFCNKCQISNMAQVFPFGLQSNHDLQNIMNSDSLRFLENLPSYITTSKAYSIDSLSEFDIDENITTNINSRYYSANEFKTITNNNSFNILHSNLNGLESKFVEYHQFINNIEMNIDILCISETSQKEDTDFNLNLTIDGYRQPTAVGSKTSKGGVAIYSKTDINTVDRNDLNIVDKSFEAVWIEIKNEKRKNIVCGCLYRHPNSDIEDFTDYLTKILAKINKENKECYISGDFNIDLLKYDTNSKYSDFLNTMTSSGFLPHILQPTRITEYSSTVIDNIYGNNFEQISQSGNILIKFADHFTQFLSINKEVTKIKQNTVYKRDFREFNEESFIDDICIQNWTAKNPAGTNPKIDDFLWRLDGCIDRHAPLKKMNKKQLNKISKPLINKFILKMISHRDRLFKKKKEDPLNQHIKQSYNLFRNRTTREIKKSRRKYYKEYFEGNLNNMKKTWQGIKQIININNKAGVQINQLCHKGKQINTNQEMANTFNEFFTEIGPQLDKEIPQSKRPGGCKIYLNSRIPNSFLISITDPQEISDIINNFDDSKATGPCSVPIKLLKLARNELSIPFSDICNTSFTEGIFPDFSR